MQKTVLVVGNALLTDDSHAIRIIHRIQDTFPDTAFIPWDPTEDFPSTVSGDILLIDSVVGIDTVTVYHSLKSFAVSPRNTVHDYDIPLAVGIQQKLGIIRQVTIIGIPVGGTMKDRTKKLLETLSEYL